MEVITLSLHYLVAQLVQNSITTNNLREQDDEEEEEDQMDEQHSAPVKEDSKIDGNKSNATIMQVKQVPSEQNSDKNLKCEPPSIIIQKEDLPNCAPPPPPPPPPMLGAGPPPPPPPLGGGLPPMGMNSSLPSLPTKKPTKVVRSFFFEPLSKNPNDLKETIFIKKNIALDSNDILDTLDADMLENMFAANANVSKVDAAPAVPKKNYISVIEDSNRSHAISLRLGSLKNQGLSVDKIAAAVLSMDDSVLEEGALESLAVISPTNEELTTLRNLGDVDHGVLQEPEQLFFKLINLNNIPARLTCWLFTLRFDKSLSRMDESIEIILSACVEVGESKKWLSILSLILTVGNYMNGGKKGKNYGFKLSSLVRLNDTKATDGSHSTLLQFLVQWVEKSHPHLLDVDSELTNVSSACKTILSSIKEDASKAREGVNLINEQVRSINNSNSCSEFETLFKNKMVSFNQSASDRLKLVENKITSSQEKLCNLAKLYNESEQEILAEPDKFFQHIDNFVQLFKQCISNLNEKRKIEEQKLLRRSRASFRFSKALDDENGDAWKKLMSDISTFDDVTK
ncbi:hypothetical protein AKO1_012769 [Acrasis kona]|uniref:FH2 domain-containing protein n=1 Tax=Acrasis kona TaxID=1008807 RepID=A0AAW2YKZ4_9EUKA